MKLGFLQNKFGCAITLSTRDFIETGFNPAKLSTSHPMKFGMLQKDFSGAEEGANSPVTRSEAKHGSAMIEGARSECIFIR